MFPVRSLRAPPESRGGSLPAFHPPASVPAPSPRFSPPAACPVSRGCPGQAVPASTWIFLWHFSNPSSYRPQTGQRHWNTLSFVHTQGALHRWSPPHAPGSHRPQTNRTLHPSISLNPPGSLTFPNVSPSPGSPPQARSRGQAQGRLCHHPACPSPAPSLLTPDSAPPFPPCPWLSPCPLSLGPHPTSCLASSLSLQSVPCVAAEETSCTRS